jgi:CRP/FNR family cyclic AMP-dependent transcriptional regulator
VYAIGDNASESTAMTSVQPSLNVPAFLGSAGVKYRRVQRRRGEAVFTQGDPCDHVGFIESGRVTLSVISTTGKEGIVALLGCGDFLGEACLAGQPFYTATATAIAPSTICDIEKHDMLHLLRGQHAMSDRFIAHMLARNIRIEADLVDHLFNSCEKRLARDTLAPGRLRNVEHTRPRQAEDLAGSAWTNGRHHALTD